MDLYVSGLPCEVQSVEDDRITCKTAEQPMNGNMTVHPGENRLSPLPLCSCRATSIVVMHASAFIVTLSEQHKHQGNSKHLSFCSTRKHICVLMPSFVTTDQSSQGFDEQCTITDNLLSVRIHVIQIMQHVFLELT